MIAVPIKSAPIAKSGIHHSNGFRKIGSHGKTRARTHPIPIPDRDGKDSSSGADCWKHFRSCIAHLGFTSYKADPDIWMREGKKDDGSVYWEYVLLYVDDALWISNNAENVLRNEIGKYFVMKPGSIGPPKIYLGNKVSKVTLDNDVDAWSFSSSQYVKNAVVNVEAYLCKLGKSLPRKVTAPLTMDYRPEIDTTAEVDPI